MGLVNKPPGKFLPQRKTYFKRYRERAQGMILAEVMKYGYTVLIPFGEGRRYDMVIEKDAQFFRLQCKAGRYENGVVKFNTCSVHWWANTELRTDLLMQSLGPIILTALQLMLYFC